MQVLSSFPFCLFCFVMEVRQFTNISSLGSTTCTLTINKDSEGHYIRKETLISAFQLDEEEGVGIGPFGSSEYVCDEPKFRIDPSVSRWEVLGFVDVNTPSLEILSEEGTPPTELLKSEVGSSSNPLTFSDDETSQNLGISSVKPFKSPSKEYQVVGRLPEDIDGSIWFCSPVLEHDSSFDDGRGNAFSSIAFFQSNRNWSHATNTSAGKLEKYIKVRQPEACPKVVRRISKCLGVFICDNDDCPFRKLHETRRAFRSVESGGLKDAPPQCPDCMQAASFIPCEARLIRARVVFTDSSKAKEQYFAEHVGTHSCPAFGINAKKKRPSQEMQQAVTNSVGPFAMQSACRVRNACTMQALQDFLSGDTTFQDVSKMAFEVQDSALLGRAIQDTQQAKRQKQAAKAPEDKMLKEMKKKLDDGGYRVFISKHVQLAYFMCPVDNRWSSGEIMHKMDRVFGKWVICKYVVYVVVFS